MATHGLKAEAQGPEADSTSELSILTQRGSDFG